MAGNKKSSRKSANVRRTLLLSTPLTTESEAGLLNIKPYLRLEEFIERNGSLQGWRDISFRLSVGLEFADIFFKEEEKEVLMLAVNAICDVKDRWSRTDNKWGISDEEIQYIRQGLEVTDGMQDLTTRKEQMQVYIKVDKLIKQQSK
jgi:hypothetical protein